MKIAVIGGGLAGMSAAYDLSNAGHEVIIFEASSYTGGLAAGFKSKDWDWHLEHFYHHWFETDDDMLTLIDELGERDKVFFPRPITSLYLDGKIYPIDSPVRVMLLPKLSIIDKIRFGVTMLYLRLTKNWQALEKEPAHAWLNRAMGKKAYQVLMEPLLIGKFGDYYQDVNMAWLWARIHKRSFKLGYFEGGFQAFIDILTQRIETQGVKIKLNSKIARIVPQGQAGFQVELAAAPTETKAELYDKVLATVSPQLLGHLVPTLPSDYLAALTKLKSMGAVVVVLALKHSLNARHYWINLPKGENVPFLALVEHTNFVDRKHYNGDHIIYCGDYLKPEHAYFSMSKEDILQDFLPSLKQFNPEFDESWVKESWLFTAKYAQPVPPLNHSANIPPLETPLPGLYWASMSQVYPWDRGTNYAVAIGRQAAQALIK